mmetsp:Transcript_21704/g.33736  ORF Transcript_21704/g.33736 Transcript_21704/m.33736 type:complete len:472 (-) Transcript_21704:10-1425(-)
MKHKNTQLQMCIGVGLLLFVVVVVVEVDGKHHRHPHISAFGSDSPITRLLNESNYKSSYHLSRPINTCNLEKSFSYDVDAETEPPSMYDYPPTEIVRFKCGKKCFGLGDVLKGMASTAMMSVLSNHKFEMEVRHPPLNHFYDYPDFVVHDLLHLPRHVVSYNKDNRKLSMRVQEGGIYDIDKAYLVETNANFIKHIVNDTSVHVPKLARAFNGRVENEYIMGCVLRFLLKPTPRLLNLVATVIDGVKDEVLIGVHIRTGDRLSKRTPVWKIEKFFDCYRDHLGDLAEKYYTYLAVDQQELYEIIENRFNSSHLLTYPDRGAPGHSDRDCPRGRCEILRERTVIEHYLLTSTDSLITSRSGFSTSAAQMGEHYDFILIDSFCACVQGTTVHDFMETRDGRSFPVWNKPKCEKYNPGSTYIAPKPTERGQKREGEEESEHVSGGKKRSHRHRHKEERRAARLLELKQNQAAAG